VHGGNNDLTDLATRRWQVENWLVFLLVLILPFRAQTRTVR
jgi:hypothetical protein